MRGPDDELASRAFQRWRAADLLGVRFAAHIFVATSALWALLRLGADANPIWGISAMIAVSDPNMNQALATFRGRIINSLQDLGILDFGKGVTAAANIALWRERGTHQPLCGEFTFQARFTRRDELHEKAIERCRRFFIALQTAGHDWLSLGTTKTGLVYRLSGNPPQPHE